MRLLRPFFQPVCRLSKGGMPDVCYYEALMRVDGDVSGQIHTRLIPVAEHFGFIGALDLEMLKTILQVLQEARGLQVGVNLSVDTLEFFTEQVLREVHAHDRDIASRLVVEITETHEPESYDAVLSAARKLREAGCMLAMDDFGDGFADERMVECIEPRFIKLSARALDDPALVDRALVLAHEQQAEVIAEQVRNEADVAHLIDAGVTYGQGYFFGKPQAVIHYKRTAADWKLQLTDRQAENPA